VSGGHTSPLERSGLPLFFRVTDEAELGLTLPEPRLGNAVRTLVRSLSHMQKEALVTSSATGTTWRLASDEGPYLAGDDVAPPPLGLFTTGMVASYMSELLALAEAEGVDADGARLILDNYYSMEGSALRGTMLGGALQPQLTLEAPAGGDRLGELLTAATASSPVNGLLCVQHSSLFTLSVNGRETATGRVEALGRPAEPDPGDRFGLARPDPANTPDDLVVKVRKAEEVEGVPGGAGSSLQAEQSRTLHVRGACTVRPDGVKEIEQSLFRPIGSAFRFLSDEPPGRGGEGRAPDAATYLSAGIGFCFMTQLGRYAAIVRRELADYRIVQDTHFSLGSVPGETAAAGEADPVETHLYLATPEDADFARQALDMGERTCFLHALCRTPLQPRIAVSAPAEA
jgi:hypothetical protein